MRVLLDECVPVPLKREFAEFDAVLTIDRGLDKSLRESDARIGVILMRAGKTDLRVLLPLVPAVKSALRRIHPGEVATVDG